MDRIDHSRDIPLLQFLTKRRDREARIRMSNELHISKRMSVNFGKTTKPNFQENASFPQSTKFKIDNHKYK